MSKTNSNSITSILIYALNKKDSPFRKEMLQLFGNKGVTIPEGDTLEFYDGTHSPLNFKSMRNKEVDIYARIPGKYKVYLMIEVKAGIRETLQKSQQQKGEYQKTSENENIPLFFIIPKLYTHRKKLSFIENHIIEWEEILKVAESYKDETDISNQIMNFVEVTQQESYLSDIVKKIKDIKQINKLLEKRQNLKDSLKQSIKVESRKTFSESDYEFGYYWNHGNYFFGYNYFLDEYILSLDIAESKLNNEIDKNKIYYLGGWFFIPANPIDNNSLNLQNLVRSKKYENLQLVDIKMLKKLNNYEPEEQQLAYHIRTTFNNLFNNFIEENQNLVSGNSQENEYGKGFYFKDKTIKGDFFIGLAPQLIGTQYEENILSIAYKPSNRIKLKSNYIDKDGYYYFPIDIKRLLKNKTQKELQNEFNSIGKNILKNIREENDEGNI